MARYDTSDLYHRQHPHGMDADAGSTSPPRWRGLQVPLAVTALGIVLALWGPLPGLGLFLTMGGVMALVTSTALVVAGG